MARATIETLNLDEMPEADRNALADELYEVQAEVFAGVDHKRFVTYVIESPSDSNLIEVYRVEGRAVGYFALHRFDQDVGGRPTSIFRGEAGVRRAFRGRTPFARLFLRRALPWIIAHRGREHFFLGSLVHPSSYHGIARYARTVWPNPSVETPPELQQLLCDLGDRFGLERVDPDNPLIRAVGWRTRDTDVEALYWQQCSKPTAKFFVDQNPGYGEGHGMLTLVPLALSNVLPGAGSLLWGRARRTATRVRAAVQRVPMLRPRVKPKAIENKLSALDALKKLDARGRARLVLACRTSLAAPGQYIIREGERGDRMFMILNGAVFVVRGSGDDEVVLDELHEGEVFGEMALMSGAPRTASVRAATSLLLLEIERSAVMALAAADENVLMALESAHDGRAFDTAVNTSERFGHVGHDDRWHWFESGEIVKLTGDAAFEVPAGAVAFLAIGEAEACFDERWVSLQAPALFGGDGAFEIRGQGERCRLAVLPPRPPGQIALANPETAPVPAEQPPN